MKPIYIFITILLMACKNSTGPILVFSTEKIEIDSIAPDSKQIIEFKIYNKGDRKLIIQDYISSCECTLLDLKPNTVIESNDSLPIRMSIQTFKEDTGKLKSVICTFKNNSDSSFKHLPIYYHTKNTTVSVPNNI